LRLASRHYLVDAGDGALEVGPEIPVVGGHRALHHVGVIADDVAALRPDVGELAPQELAHPALHALVWVDELLPGRVRRLLEPRVAPEELEAFEPAPELVRQPLELPHAKG